MDAVGEGAVDVVADVHRGPAGRGAADARPVDAVLAAGHAWPAPVALELVALGHRVSAQFRGRGAVAAEVPEQPLVVVAQDVAAADVRGIEIVRVAAPVHDRAACEMPLVAFPGDAVGGLGERDPAGAERGGHAFGVVVVAGVVPHPPGLVLVVPADRRPTVLGLVAPAGRSLAEDQPGIGRAGLLRPGRRPASRQHNACRADSPYQLPACYLQHSCLPRVCGQQCSTRWNTGRPIMRANTRLHGLRRGVRGGLCRRGTEYDPLSCSCWRRWLWPLRRR